MYLTVILMFCAAVTAACQSTQPGVVENPAFEKIKSLVGEWDGVVTEDGMRVKSLVRVISNGSAVLHVEMAEGEQDIVTVFYPVGAELRADHYCYLKNQPRFVVKTSAADPNTLRFEVREITNSSAAPNGRHMHATTWRLSDRNHLTQEWHMFENGKEMKVFIEKFTRVK